MNSDSLFTELDFKVYARILWRWSWLIALSAITAAVAAYIASSLSEPIYQSSTTLLIDQARSSTNVSMQDLMTNERIASTYAELIKRSSLLDKVAHELQVESAIFNTALTAVNVSTVRNTQLMKVSVEGTSPQLVMAVADMLPKAFVEELKEVQSERYSGARTSLEVRLQEINDQIELTQANLDKLESIAGAGTNSAEQQRLRDQLTRLETNANRMYQSLETLTLTEAQSGDSITVVEPPILPSTPIRPRILVNTLLAAIVGLMLALGLIFLIEYMDDRVKSPQDLQRITDAPVLGMIMRITAPKRDGDAQALGIDESLITAIEPRNPISEAYRSLRTNLMYASVDSGLNSLLITSTSPGEGKTTTAANLAIVMAQSGRSVILVDADLRKPRHHNLFEQAQSPGLSEALLLGDTQPEGFLHTTDTPNLRLLTSGKIPPNPAELLGSQRMKQLIQHLSELAEIVIFDGPPLLVVTDAQVLAGQVKGVMVVIDSTKTQRTAVARVLEILGRSNANLLGILFNRISRSSRGYGYYYEQYNYYYSNETETKQAATSWFSLGKKSKPIAQKANKPEVVPQPSVTKEIQPIAPMAFSRNGVPDATQKTT